jgi:hypothetical protein
MKCFTCGHPHEQTSKIKLEYFHRGEKCGEVVVHLCLDCEKTYQECPEPWRPYSVPEFKAKQ